MAICLKIVEVADRHSEYTRSFLQDRIAIGRARSADVCLPDMAVSMRHAEIRFQDSEYMLVDLGSLNGTQLNGKNLIAHRPRQLQNDDAIDIAGFCIHFRLGVAQGPIEPRDISLRQARQMLSQILARTGDAQNRQSLIVVGGPAKASRFDLPPPPSKLVIGRSPECSVQLDDLDVSRRHAEIVVETDGIFVRDLGSHNGVVIDGQKVEAAKLEPGLQFTLGQTVLTVEQFVAESLNDIFEAPEEQTSSFVLGAATSNSPEKTVIQQDAKSPDTAEDKSKAAPQLVPAVGIGPVDPLAVDCEHPQSKTTGHIPFYQAEQGSDLGLIIIGAIIVIAAVIGLVYLLT